MWFVKEMLNVVLILRVKASDAWKSEPDDLM